MPFKLPSSAPGQSPPPPAAGVAWIDAKTAAERMGCNERHLRRLCGGEWQRNGLARLERPAGGGKSCWRVREDAHPALARVQFPQHLPSHLKDIPTPHRKAALDRKQILVDWDQAIAAGLAEGKTSAQATERFLDRLDTQRGVRISGKTLYQWQSDYRAAGLDGLIDGRCRPDRVQERASDPFFTEVKKHYLHPRRLKLTVCYELASLKAEEQGWERRGFKACQRFIATIPPATVSKLRHGVEAYTNEAQPFIERDYTTLRSNEVWCGDHHQFDVIVESGGKLIRPWITAWQDCRSRKIVGWRIFAHDPNQDTIFLAFYDAVHPEVGNCGVPENVYVDNGRDYDCYALNGRTKQQRWELRKVNVQYERAEVNGLFGELGVGVSHCEPYHGQSKPIERWFRTLEEKFGVTWDTYCGNSPANKPECLADQLQRGHAPTLSDFVTAFKGWLADGYHAHAHFGDGMGGKTPDQVFAENLQTKRVVHMETLRYLLQKKTQPVKVTQNGVTHGGLRYGQYEPALQLLLHKEVYLRVDPNDVSRVTVWKPDGRFVCWAEANQRVPFLADAQTLREAQAQKRRHAKLASDYADSRPRLHEDLPDLLIRAAAAKRAQDEANRPPEPPRDGPTIQPVQHPITEQLPAIQRSEKLLRRAAGAEGMSGGSSGGATSGGGFCYRGRPEAESEGATTDEAPTFRQLMSGRENSQEEAHG